MTPDPFQLDRDPDLQIADLRLWVRDREFPDANDYWDGNWLHVHAIVETETSSVRASGTFVHLGDLKRFLDELTDLHETLNGSAHLRPMEPNVAVDLEGNGRGQIDVAIRLTADHMAESHEFRDDFDQTRLPAIATAVRRILERLPIKAPEQVRS